MEWRDPAPSSDEYFSQSQLSQSGTVLGGEYMLMHTIGVGEFSKVKVARHVATGEHVAVKILPVQALRDHPVLRREILIHFKLDHRRVVPIRKLIDTDPDYVFIILDLAVNGELFDRIEPDYGVPPATARFYFLQLLEGMEYIHGAGVAHRDLKPENLLLDADGSLLITDFGFATECVDESGAERVLSTKCGSPPYVAPEVLTGAYSGPTADLWSAAVILYVMLTGQIPWDAPTHHAFEFTAVASGNFDFEPWSKLPAPVLDVLKAILVLDPTQRPSIAELRAMPWLAGTATPAALSPASPSGSRKRARSNAGSQGSQEPAASAMDELAALQLDASPPPMLKRRKTLGNAALHMWSQQDPAIGPPQSQDPSLLRVDTSEFSIHSYSQPTRVDELLADTENDAAEPATFCNVIERMTRISRVAHPRDFLRSIRGVLQARGGVDIRVVQGSYKLRCAFNPPRGGRVSFIVRLLKVPDKPGTVMAEFTRGRGPILEFKRMFRHVRNAVDALDMPAPSVAPAPLSLNLSQ